MGPFSAIYEVVTVNSRNNERERQINANHSPRPSSDSNPPTYEQVVTALKSPSATYNMQYYPQVLSPQNLAANPPQRPPPPSYENITSNGAISNFNININNNNNHHHLNQNTRRMTIV